MNAASKIVASAALAVILLEAAPAVPRSARSSAAQSKTSQVPPSPPSAAQAAAAQSPAPDWQKAAGGKLQFDVASVKQNNSGPPPSGDMPNSNVPISPGDAYPPNGGLFKATKLPLLAYITFAYKIMPGEVQGLMASMPKWTLSESFDIEARAEGNPTKDQMRLMMQSLLADRFKLAIHTETQQRQVFALVLEKPGKTGPQLQPHSDDSPACAPATDATLPLATATVPGGFPTVCGSIMLVPSAKPGRLGVGARDIPMGLIASTLGAAGSFVANLTRPVIDQTGLAGTYDFLLDFAPELPTGVKFQSDDSAPTFLEALKEQLGLKLDPQTGPVSVIIIDHIEPPSEN